MKPVFEVHPSWIRPELGPVSDTWRWFHLERWMQSTTFAASTPCEPIEFDAAVPAGYASVLRTSAWIVLEAVRRDGSARRHLSLDDVRWARRMGLALLGHHTIASAAPASVRSASVGVMPETEEPDDRLVAAVVLLFPESDRPILRLALAAIARPTKAGPLDVSPESGRTDRPFGNRFVVDSLPEVKTTLLVRLAKRHAGAAAGVELPLTGAGAGAKVDRAVSGTRLETRHAHGSAASAEPYLLDETSEVSHG